MYDPKLKKVIGRHDREPISEGYVKRIQFHQKSLKNLTKAERHFEERIAKVIRDEGRASYVTPKPFFFADQIAFIADFHFQKFRAVIEIDGGSHYGEKSREYDAWRDRLLKEYCHIDVLRLSNAFVLRHTNEAFNTGGSVPRRARERNAILSETFPQSLFALLLRVVIQCEPVDSKARRGEGNLHLQYKKQEMKGNGDSRHSHIKLLFSLCVSDRTVLTAGETTSVSVLAPCL